MSTRSERRLDRIKEEIDIVELLVGYGYGIMDGGGDRQQQFQCDLHGDGLDGKPSARVYPESQSWYCWGCDLTRDAVETVREKQGIGFLDAMSWLEQRFNLPSMGWEEGDYTPTPEIINPMEQYLGKARTFQEEKESLETFLLEITVDQELPRDSIMGFWEAFDMLRYRLQQGMAEARLAPAMAKLRQKIIAQSIAHQKTVAA